MDGFRQLLESDMKKSAMVNFFNKKFMHKNIILDPNDNKLSFGYLLFYVQTHFSAYYGMYQLIAMT